jgi:hypothetical protein
MESAFEGDPDSWNLICSKISDRLFLHMYVNKGKLVVTGVLPG